MERLLQDLKSGLRQLIRYPGMTLLSAVALGLGISSVTTQLSVTKGLFLDGLPYQEAAEIAHLEWFNPEEPDWNAEPLLLEFIEWRNRQEAFEGLAGLYRGTANFTLGETVRRFNGCFISANAFELLGVQALLGRGLHPGDDQPGSPGVVVLSHKVWQRDFGADPDLVGSSAVLNGRPVTVVGVMPEGFHFPLNEEIWVPLFQQARPGQYAWGDEMMSLEVFGRLRDGTDYDQANALMSTVANRMAEDLPNHQDHRRTIRVQPFIKEFIGGETIPMTSIMLLITFLILVIACANVANLLLARAMRRRKEIAIRAALGASPGRLVSQFLTESTLLAALGALLGVVLAHRNVTAIQSMKEELNTPYWIEFSIDYRVLLAVVLVAIGTGLLSGLVPALRASRVDEAEVLKDDTRTSSSLHLGNFGRILVILQITVAAVVLTLVVLFVRSVRGVLEIEYAYDPDGALSARMGLFEETYPTDTERRNFLTGLMADLRALPEIEHAAITSRYKFKGGSFVTYGMPGRVYASELERDYVHWQRVSGDFFNALQLPLIRGRGFEPADFGPGWPRVAVVNEAFALREWGTLEVVGQQFRPGLGADVVDFADIPLVEIVGVVPDMQERNLFGPQDDGAAFYLPQTDRFYPQFVTLLVRGSGDPEALAPLLRKAVMARDSNLPLYEVGTPRQLNNRDNADVAFFSSIFFRFGTLATLLAGVGIYGVMSFSVNQRIMEFGIRQALGATRTAIFRLVYSHAFRQLAIGFLFALLVLSPLLVSETVQSWMVLFFYGIDPDSVVPYLYAFGFTTLVAVLAAALPAVRAARIHPARALRHE